MHILLIIIILFSLPLVGSVAQVIGQYKKGRKEYEMTLDLLTKVSEDTRKQILNDYHSL